jgi:glycosyltransferase involved in cell wall biosynthesis
MAAYNTDETLRQAVGSVLRSTYPADLYIVDDCSRIPVADVLGPLPERIEVIRLETNSGPAVARNVGLQRILARDYRYVAIADADDICHPNRIARQVAFLENNAKVGAVGGWARFINESTGEMVLPFTPPTDPAALRKAMFFNINCSHTSCMIRTEALMRVGLYSKHYPAAEDYELLRRIATQYDVANVPEFVMDYRISLGGISVRRRRRQLFDRLRIQTKYFEPREWRAWAGILNTVSLFLLPRTLVTKLKSARRRRARMRQQIVVARQ